MNRVRLGVIGCGGMSRHHGRIFTQSVSEAEIVALVEPDEKNLARYIADVFPNALNPASGHGVHARVHQSNLPGLGVGIMHLHRILLQVYGYIGLVQKIIGEIFFYIIALVAQAYHKIVKAEAGVNFHDVPENGFVAYLNHRFWPQRGFFR